MNTNFYTKTHPLHLKIIFCLIMFIVGCQNLPKVEPQKELPTNKNDKRSSLPVTPPIKDSPVAPPPDDYEDTRDNPPYVEEGPKTDNNGSISAPAAPIPTRPTPSNPKIGIIIGPGFLRSFLAVGILQEFHKAKLPVQALIGFEWGSLPAALYSANGQSNEVEWQMLKLNEGQVIKKSLIRNQVESQSTADLQTFLSQAFDRKQFEQTRIPFECLTFDYKKKQYFWMKKGEIAKAMPYCLASPPFFKPYLNNVGALDLKLAADNLRQKGANYIILINPLSSTKDYLDDNVSIESQVLWAFHQYELMKTSGVVDFVVDTSSAAFSVLDFGARRDMIRKGQEIGAQAVKKLGSKLGI